MSDGDFETYGGRHVPEPLHEPLERLANAYDEIGDTAAFQETLRTHLAEYAGRPTPLYRAGNLSDRYGAEIYPASCDSSPEGGIPVGLGNRSELGSRNQRQCSRLDSNDVPALQLNVTGWAVSSELTEMVWDTICEGVYLAIAPRADNDHRSLSEATVVSNICKDVGALEAGCGVRNVSVG